MSEDLPAIDAQLDTLWPDRAPWRLPEPPPPPVTGDEAVDADLGALARRPQDAIAQSEAQKRLIATLTPGVVDACLAWLRAFVGQELPRPIGAFDGRLVSHLPEALQARALVRANDASNELFRRWSIVRALVSVLATAPDPPTTEQLLAETERPAIDSSYRASIADALFASATKRDAPQARPVLDRFVAHAAPDDPLLPWAAVSLVRIDEDAALARLAPVVQAMTDPWLRTKTAIALSKVVHLDDRPAWVDLICKDVLGTSWAIEVSYAFHALTTAAPLVLALRHANDEPNFTDLLSALRRVDDPRSAAALQALAATLPDAPKGSKIARSKQGVASLVKRLGRKRDVVDRSSFELRSGVGTDGGPVVVLPATVAGTWQGASEAYGEAGAPEDDYARACAAGDDGGVAVVKFAGGQALVLPLQSAQVATIVDAKAGETRVFLLTGTDVMLEMAMKERGAWKKTKHSITLDDDAGLTLLDASMTTARADAQQKKHEPLAKGTYAVDELNLEVPAGGVHAVRLRAAAPPKNK